MKIVTLFSRFGTDMYTDTDIHLKSDLQKLLPKVDRDFIIIDTTLPETLIERHADGTVLLGASNRNWEFGAWDRALQYLGTSIYLYDYIHIVTSALYNGYIDFHQLLSKEMLQRFSGRSVALGHIEVYNDPVIFQDVRFQAWLRSSYIFLPPAELRMLGNIVTVDNINKFFSEDFKRPFLNDAPLCAQYKKNILSWLTGDGLGQGTIWHSRFQLSPDTFTLFKKKSMAIFNEMSLSNRLAAQGCCMVDMTWAYRHQDAATLPTWYEQVITRGTGHEFIVEK